MTSTPGPWRIDSDGDDIFVIGRPKWKCTRFGIEGEWDVATVTDLDEDNKAETISNARLIAAAPDLLEALKAISGYTNMPSKDWREKYPELSSDLRLAVDDDERLSIICDYARAAIANAEGRAESLPLSKGQEEGNG